MYEKAEVCDEEGSSMRIRIQVYTGNKAEYRIRCIRRWLRDTALPVADWALGTLMYVGIAGMLFFACGADSVDLEPVIKGLAVSTAVTVGSGLLRKLI